MKGGFCMYGRRKFSASRRGHHRPSQVSNRRGDHLLSSANRRGGTRGLNERKKLDKRTLKQIALIEYLMSKILYAVKEQPRDWREIVEEYEEKLHDALDDL